MGSRGEGAFARMPRLADIAVVGSGAAGIAAAVSAARAGHTTLLIDARPAPGGTGGFSGLTTLCGLYDDDGRLLNGGFATEFVQALDPAKPVRMGRGWVLPYRPARFSEAAAALRAAAPTLECHWKTRLADVVVTDNQISSLNGFSVKAVIDCSGNAEVARAVGVPCLETNEATQASAIIFSLSNVTCPLDTPAAVARVLLPLARAGLPPLSFQPSLERGTITVKFSGQRNQVEDVIGFLQSNIAGFENCVFIQTDLTPARRAGRMIPGQ